jgi:hypothetical protein
MTIDDADARAEHLQGRIIALELFIRAFLTDFVMDRYEDPEDGVERLHRDFVASLQHLERPLDDVSDRVWAHVANAIDAQFEGVAMRVRNLRSE